MSEPRRKVVWWCAGCKDCEPPAGVRQSRMPCSHSPSADGVEVVEASAYDRLAARVRELEASQALAVKDRNEAEDENVWLDGRVRELEGLADQFTRLEGPSPDLVYKWQTRFAAALASASTPESGLKGES